MSFEYTAIEGITTPVSRVGFGMYHLAEKLGDGAAIDWIGNVVNRGITLFDTSSNYFGTELLLGQALRERLIERDEVVIASKVGLADSFQKHARGEYADTSPDNVARAVDTTIRMLGEAGLGYVDLYQLHVYDEKVKPQRHAEAFAELINVGKIKAWGVSNYTLQQTAELIEVCDDMDVPRPATAQPMVSALFPNTAAESAAFNDMGMTVLGYGPLARGALTDSTLFGGFKYFVEGENLDEEKDDAILFERGFEYMTKLGRCLLNNDINNISFGSLLWAYNKADVVLSGATAEKQFDELEKLAEIGLPECVDEILDEFNGFDMLEDFQDLLIDLARSTRLYYR